MGVERAKAFLVWGVILAIVLAAILVIFGGYDPWGAIKAVGATFVVVFVVIMIVVNLAS